MANEEERKPILQDSGIHVKPSGSSLETGPESAQHLIIQPIEFDHKHRNLYGYFALGAFLLVLINYLMLKERTCQVSLVNGYQDFDLIQSFHMTTLIVAVIVFVLSYFNFAAVIYEYKLIFYSAAALIFLCVGLLIYDAVTIASAPCVSVTAGGGVLSLFGASNILNEEKNVFDAKDGVGITVFLFDILAAILMFLTGRRFYQRC